MMKKFLFTLICVLGIFVANAQSIKKQTVDTLTVNGSLITPHRDTTGTNNRLFERRIRIQDTLEYICLSTTAAHKWYAFKGQGGGSGSVIGLDTVAHGPSLKGQGKSSNKLDVDTAWLPKFNIMNVGTATGAVGILSALTNDSTAKFVKLYCDDATVDFLLIGDSLVRVRASGSSTPTLNHSAPDGSAIAVTLPTVKEQFYGIDSYTVHTSGVITLPASPTGGMKVTITADYGYATSAGTNICNSFSVNGNGYAVNGTVPSTFTVGTTLRFYFNGSKWISY